MASHALRSSIMLVPRDVDDHRGTLLASLTWTLLSISALVVLARCYTKVKVARQLFWDDAFMIVALLIGFAHAVVVQLAVNEGYGEHISMLTLDQMTNSIKYGAISLAFGGMSPTAGRIGFCCTLLYLIRTDPDMRPWPVYVCIFLQFAINTTGVIIVFTQCGNDLDVLWTISKQDHYSDYCSSPIIQTYMKIVVGSLNTATDLFLTILPAVLISHTKLSRKAKFGVASLLCLSILAMVASGAKTYEAKVLQNISDYTWSIVPYTISTSVELNIIMISASLPILRPLFRRRKPPKATLESDVWAVDVQVPLASLRSSQTQNSWSSDAKQEIIGTECPLGITRTTEINVSYQSLGAPAIHADIMGMVPDDFRYPATRDPSQHPASRRGFRQLVPLI